MQYVCPSVWAWRQGRVRKIKAAVDKVLCLLPFEQAFLEGHGIAADFVGHPMASNTPVDPDAAAATRKTGAAGSPRVAVLPGSRMSEVTRLAPVFIETAALLAGRHPQIGFVAPMASAEIRAYFESALARAAVSNFILTDGDAEAVITAADVVLLASGTATLQTALLGKPMVVAYRLARLTHAIARIFDLVKVPYVSLPNLLTDEPLVPEFIQGDATPERLADAVDELLGDEARRAAIAAEFALLRTGLARDADRRAAVAVSQLAADRAG